MSPDPNARDILIFRLTRGLCSVKSLTCGEPYTSARLNYATIVCLPVFKIWQSAALTFEEAFLDNKWAKQMLLALHLQIHQLRGLGSVLRADLRRDRNAYVEALARDFSHGPSHQLYSAYHKLLVHRRKQPYRLEPLPSINKANGQACSNSAEMFQRWREHFGSLEAGSETSFSRLAAQACAQSDELRAAEWPHPSGLADVPSLPALCRVLAATKTSKAPGMDGLPPELCRHYSAALAQILHPIVLKQVWRGSEPCGWKGGMSIFFHKRRGSTSECSSYRAILLLSSLAKASHQSLRPPLKSLFESQAPPLQMGGKAGFSVTFGSHVLIRSVTRLATQAGQSSFVLFADIASAFYSTVTQLVARGEHDTTADLVKQLVAHLRLKTEDAEALGARLGEVSAMTEAGATPWLERITDMVSANNWFLLRGTPCLSPLRVDRVQALLSRILFLHSWSRVFSKRGTYCGPIPFSDPCRLFSLGTDASAWILVTQRLPVWK